MKILVFGGTRFFGVHMVNTLIEDGHEVTIATRGITKDKFGDRVKRIVVDHSDHDMMQSTFKGKEYDVVCDNLAYCSNDVRNALEALSCRRYLMVSSAAVYDLHNNTREEDFRPEKYECIWADRADKDYKEGKRLAESALINSYGSQPSAVVRFPFVIGEDDYTNRLFFYVDHIIKGIPMYIDNIDCQLGFISSDEAGRFLAFLAAGSYTGIFNGCLEGTVTIRDMINYVENKTGKQAVLRRDGDIAPYNGVYESGINTDKAESIGFHFDALKDRVYCLLDYYLK